MLKRFSFAFIVSLLASMSAFASGTIPLSMTQQLDQYGVPLSGCQLFIIQAGTTSTPQQPYADTALSRTMPNPMICDSSGRLPQFFLSDGQIKIRLLDKLGNPQVVLDNVLVIGPTSGGGSGATIDPTTIFQTGYIMQAYGTQTLTGWVRFNGRTIGSATSGATERANADTQALFLYLWGADANLTVSGGRGASAAADFAANKNIATPDFRGRAIAGLDDMGNAAAGRLTATYFGTAATVLGAAGGAESKALITGNLPAYTPTGTVANGAITVIGSTGATRFASTSAQGAIANVGGGSGRDDTLVATQATTNFTGAAQGGTSTPVAVASPMMLVTVYGKL